MMATKTYVLLEHTKSPAQVYVRVNNEQRIRSVTPPVEQAFLRIGFADKEGRNKVLRLKLNSNKIYQDEQIKDGILANAKFTTAERMAVRFRHGVLMTTNATVQEFLDAHPQNEKFEGVCHEITNKLFKEYDKSVEILSENKLFKKQLRAGNKIAALSYDDGKAMLLRLYGSFHKVPDSLEEVQNQLVNYLNDASEEQLDDILKEEISFDEQIEVLLGKAVALNIVQFDAVQDQVVKNANGKKINLKAIPSGYDSLERKRMFIEFLSSKEGRLIFDDIKKEVDKSENPSKYAPAEELKIPEPVVSVANELAQEQEEIIQEPEEGNNDLAPALVEETEAVAETKIKQEVKPRAKGKK